VLKIDCREVDLKSNDFIVYDFYSYHSLINEICRPTETTAGAPAVDDPAAGDPAAGRLSRISPREVLARSYRKKDMP